MKRDNFNCPEAFIGFGVTTTLYNGRLGQV
jgi:hypothetical protein